MDVRSRAGMARALQSLASGRPDSRCSRNVRRPWRVSLLTALTPLFAQREPTEMKRLILFCISTLVLALFVPAGARAQVGSTTDIIMGQVIGPEGQPVAGARIEVTSTESQIKRTKVTGSDGRYTILFPDGGGSYALQATAIGYAPLRMAVVRQSDEDRLVADIKLGRTATVLSAVEVRARPRPRQPTDRPEAGSTERGLPSGLVNRLPIDAGDLNTLATLAPGVVGIVGTDSTAASFSVAGQPPSQNNLTLDGLSFGSGSVPTEAVRGTRVITNTYDVARGQFTGGQVATTTRGGTNLFAGAVGYSLRDPSLEFAQEEENTFTQKYTQNQVNLGIGGPIVKDKLFIFGAASFSRREDPLQSLLAADPLALQRIGANGDSVQRFLGILNKYGLQPTSPLIPDQRLNNNGSAIVRMDYSLGEAHSLMLRGDWRGSTQDASRISPFSVPHSGGDGKTSGGGGMITLTSHWENGLINELRAYTSTDTRNTDPYLMVPSGRVVVASTLDDGTSAVSTLQFGVNPSLPQESHTRLIETSDELSRVSTGGAHRVKLGGLLNEQTSSTGSFSNVLGTYTFNSLADFENGTAASFTRTLSTNKREARSVNAALYLGDSWRRTPRLQLTYGLRLEGSKYPDAPPFNPVVDSLFNRRTDQFPSETHLSPRLGFSYSYGGASERQPLGSIRGGLGEFRGKAPSQIFASAADANGLSNGQSQLICVGPSVPAPDWPAFIENPALVPSSCNGPSQLFGNQRRNVTLLAPDFGAPRAWRGSFGINRRIAERYTVSVDAAYSRGVAQTSAIDLNLNTVPKFTLAGEGGRPVYTPANSIVPTTGVVALSGSRIQPSFGVVSELNSNLHSDTKQITASLNGITTRAISFNTSYTFTRSRDQSQGLSSFGGGGGGGFGGGGAATTAGNPNLSEWGTSDLERRHSFLATLTWPLHPALELTAIGRLSSGAFFTPTVSGDVNGDGLRNDRSFIFNPATAPDTAIANGMARLLASAPARAQECLQSQLGAIAGRNSCSVPWSTSLDLQANFKPAAFGLNRKLTISLIGLNTLTGIDQLLHGNNNLHGWGQPVFPDRTLLYVRGFDPVAQRYIYQVNEHFGAANGSRNAFRVPFQLALTARLTLGTDPARQQMNAAFGGAGGRRPTAADFRERLARAVPNTFREILDLNDSLKLALTADQQAQLKVAGDSLQAKADTLIGALAQTLGNTDKNADPMQLGMKMRGKIQEGRTLAQKAVADAQKILTPDQWAKVPKSIKDPLPQRQGGDGGGFRGPDR